jgi:AbrB family looped-hinge helix DNA binding protein
LKNGITWNWRLKTEDRPMPPYVTKVTSKGQLTIPIEFRRELGIDAGDSVEVERVGNKLVLMRTGSVTERTAGLFAKYRKSSQLSAQEERALFEQAVADEQVETDERIRGTR